MTPERIDRFIDKLLDTHYFRQTFAKLCTGGCDKRTLAGLLYGVSTAVTHVHSAQGKEMARSRKVSSGLSDSAIRNLPERLAKLADKVERANADPLVGPIHLLEAKFKEAKLPEEAKSRAEWRCSLYSLLPLLMRQYADDVRLYSGFARKVAGPKRVDLDRMLTFSLLDYVRSMTGKAHFEELASLLDRGRQVVGAATSESLLGSTITGDALKQLYRRGRQYQYPPSGANQPK